jgi:4-cresol dehydrogenase (hydroxylating)
MKLYSMQEKVHTLQQVLPLLTTQKCHKNLGEFPVRKIHGYLQVSQIKDLRTLLKICTLPGDPLPIYPYSSGKNWGLGSALPSQDGGILLDLSPMNKIVDLDLKTGIAVIEPGVTQLQLSQALEDTTYMLNVTSSHTTTSILGNALDRGVGFHRQRTQDLIGAEILLSSGETIHLGGYWSLCDDPKKSFHYPHGLGPNLLPLLFQSNLGIVTKGVISLLPRPEKRMVFKIVFPMEQFNAVVDTFRQLYRDDSIKCVMKIYSASAAHMYSGGSVSSQTFHGYFSLEGIHSVVREKMFHVEHFCKNFGLEEINAEASDLLSQMIYHCFHGNPIHNDAMINASFNVNDGDLDRHSQEGWISFLPIVPFDAQSLQRAFELIYQCTHMTTVRPMATMNILSKDAVDLVIALRFQREPQPMAEVRQVLDRLYETFTQAGFYPYRLDVDHMDFVVQHTKSQIYLTLLQGIKHAFDPEGIMSPGRYGV